MKFFISIFIFLFAFSVQSQVPTFQRTLLTESWNSEVNDIVALDSSWVICGRYRDCDMAFAMKLSLNGNVEWTKGLRPPYYLYYSSATEIDVLSDGKIVFTGNNLGNDDAGGDEFVFVQKYDLQGNLIFDKEFRQYSENLQIKTPLVELSNNHFFLGIEDTLLELSPQGDSLNKLSLGKGNFNHLFRNDPNKVLASTDQGVLVLDSLGNQTQFRNFNEPVLFSYSWKDSLILILTNKQLVALDSGLNPVKTIPLDTVFSEITDFQVQNERYYISGKDVMSNKSLVLAFDKNHQEIRALTLENEQLNIKNVEINDSILAITGLDDFTQESHAFTQTFDTYNNSQVDSIDLEISYVKGIDTVKRFIGVFHNQNLVYDSLFYYDVSFEYQINNHSQTEINYFALQSDNFFTRNCENFSYNDSIKKKILPNDLLIDTFEVKNIHFSYRFRNDSNLCFYVFAPNHIRDFKRSNNSTCIKVNPLSIEKPDEIEVQVYPNPFDQQLHLSFDHLPKAEIQIFNSVGQLMISRQVENTSNASINTENLSPGIYIIQMQSNGRSFSEKLIKTN